MFRSNTAFTMERTEKMTEAMGTEGRQATRPRLSVTHLEERGSLQGMVRMPRTIRKRSRTKKSVSYYWRVLHVIPTQLYWSLH